MKTIIIIISFFILVNGLSQTPPPFNYPMSGAIIEACPGQLFTIYSQISICKECSSTASNNSGADNYVYELLSYPDMKTVTMSSGNSKEFSYLSTSNSKDGTYQYIVRVYNTKAATATKSLSPIITVKIISAKVTIIGSSIICGNGTVTLKANVDDKSTDPQNSTDLLYDWWYNGSSITGTNSSTYIADKPGIYAVQIFNKGTFSPKSLPNYQECISKSSTVAIRSISKPDSVSILVADKYLTKVSTCDSAVLRSSLRYGTFQWMVNGNVINGETDSSLVVRSTGDYSLVMYPGTVCQIQSKNVIKVDKLQVPIGQINTNYLKPLCHGDSVFLSTESIKGISFFWSKNGSFFTKQDSFYVNKTGIYTLNLLNDTNGCMNMVSKQIYVKSPDVKITYNPFSGLLTNPFPYHVGEKVEFTPNSNYYSNSACIIDTNLNIIQVDNSLKIPYFGFYINVPQGGTNYKWYRNGEYMEYSSIHTGHGAIVNNNFYLKTTNQFIGSTYIKNISASYELDGCNFISPLIYFYIVGPFEIAKHEKIFYKCAGQDSTKISIDIKEKNWNQTGDPYAKFEWYLKTNDGLVLQKSESYPDKSSLYVKNVGMYIVKVSNIIMSLIDTVYVENKNVAPSQIILPALVCKGNDLYSNVRYAKSYLWDNSITTENLPISVSGKHSLEIIDSNACYSNGEGMITISNEQLPIVKAVASEIKVCKGESILLNGSGAINYYWQDKIVDGQLISPTNSTIYTLRGVDVNGCYNFDTVLVKVNTPSTLLLRAITPKCQGQVIDIVAWFKELYNYSFQMSLTLNDSVDDPPFEYWPAGIWDNPDLTPQEVRYPVDHSFSCKHYKIEISKNKLYTATGIDRNGCISKASLQINIEHLPKMSRVKAVASRYSVCKGDSVILKAQGSNSYEWDNNVVDSVSFMPDKTKKYTVRATDLNGCQSSDTLSIKVNELPIVGISTNNYEFCLGDTVILKGTGASSYIWKTEKSNFKIETGVGFVPDTMKYDEKLIFDYFKEYYFNGSVRGYDINGCHNTNFFRIAVKSLNKYSTLTSKSKICLGESVTLSTSITNNVRYKFEWDNNVLDGIVFTPKETKKYKVKVTDLDGCSKTDSIVIMVSPLPEVISTASKSVICLGDDVVLTGIGALKYTWDNNVSNGVSFVPSATKTYTVTGTDVNGCTKTATISVSVNSLPNVIANTSKSAVCSGENLTLTGSGASTYTWDNNVSNGVSFVPSATKTYTVTGTDVNGCTKTATISVSVNSLPNVIANTSKSAVCSGENLTLTGSGASTYTWDNNVSNGVSFVPSATKTYTIAGTDVNGCTKTAIISVAVNSLPNVIANATKTTVCSGDNVTLTGEGASKYVWDNSVSNGVSFVPNATKTYTVTGTDVNGCTSTATVKVIVNSLPKVVALATKTSICFGENVSLTGSGASIYIWDNNVINGAVIIPTTTTSYEVTGTDMNGCIGKSSVTINVNQLPNVQISSNISTNKACEDEGLELSSNLNGVYAWSSGESTQTIFPTKSGIYSLKLTDVNGCSSISNAVKVTIYPLPNVVITVNGPATYCTSNLSELVSSTGVSYLWNDGSISKSIKPTTSGDYSVKVTDVNGCSNTSTPITIVVNDCAGIEHLSTMNIRVFPNPASDKFMVSLPENLGLIDLKLYDNAGKLVKIITNMEKETSISVDDLAEGIYTIKLYGDNLFYVTRVTISK